MEQWIRDCERIRLETGLPIMCRLASADEMEQVLREQAMLGWELAASSAENGTACLVLIGKEAWDGPARALLRLFFSQEPRKSEEPFAEQITAWLQGAFFGAPVPPPSRIDQQWPWREKRASFLIEQCRPDGILDMHSLQPMLQDFFKGERGSLALIPLSPLYYLLVVPLSMLGNQCEPAELLDWASGLHDLISTERMENVRLLVDKPITAPTSLPAALGRLRSLSRALVQHHPRVMVAGSWQYPLEQWAACLSSDAAESISQAIRSAVASLPLSPEQIETLETLFRCQLNVSDAARQLYLHRNTLQYRLDKLTEQTGLDPRQFPDAVLLQLLLLFRQN